MVRVSLLSRGEDTFTDRSAPLPKTTASRDTATATRPHGPAPPHQMAHAATQPCSTVPVLPSAHAALPTVSAAIHPPTASRGANPSSAPAPTATLPLTARAARPTATRHVPVPALATAVRRVATVGIPRRIAARVVNPPLATAIAIAVPSRRMAGVARMVRRARVRPLGSVVPRAATAEIPLITAVPAARAAPVLVPRGVATSRPMASVARMARHVRGRRLGLAVRPLVVVAVPVPTAVPAARAASVLVTPEVRTSRLMVSVVRPMERRASARDLAVVVQPLATVAIRRIIAVRDGKMPPSPLLGNTADGICLITVRRTTRANVKRPTSHRSMAAAAPAKGP